MRSRSWIIVGACTAGLTLSACRTVSTDQFYTLSSGANTQARHDMAGMQRYSIAVGPASIPDMIDRPQFVVRRGANQVSVLEQHRWAEPLRTGIPQAIAAELRSRLPDVQVTTAPSSASRDATYRILLDIERFESIPGTGVTIHALWTVRHGAANVLVTRQSRIDEPVSGEGYEQIASAHARALAKIGAQLADTLQALHADKRAARP